MNYVHKRGEDYGGWEDIAGQYVQVPYVDSVGTDATGETVMVYRLISDPASRIFLQTNPDGLYMRYDGVTMMATKRMANRWQGVFSLVLSKSEGRLGSSARFTPTSAQSSQAGHVRPRRRGTERLRQHRRPPDRRPAGGGQGAAALPVPVGHPRLGQPAAPDRAALLARGAGQRPRLPVRAADQHGIEHRRSPRRRRRT